MKLEPLKAYRVTKGNTDGCLVKGDFLWQSENGILNAFGGFMTPDELTPEIMDFEAEPDNDYVVYAFYGHEMIVKKTENMAV